MRLFSRRVGVACCVALGLAGCGSGSETAASAGSTGSGGATGATTGSGGGTGGGGGTDGIGLTATAPTGGGVVGTTDGKATMPYVNPPVDDPWRADLTKATPIAASLTAGGSSLSGKLSVSSTAKSITFTATLDAADTMGAPATMAASLDPVICYRAAPGTTSIDFTFECDGTFSTTAPQGTASIGVGNGSPNFCGRRVVTQTAGSPAMTTTTDPGWMPQSGTEHHDVTGVSPYACIDTGWGFSFLASGGVGSDNGASHVEGSVKITVVTK